MGTLKKLKMKMKLDRDLRGMLVRGTKDEILIDIDGDKQADLALMDISGNGDVDTLAIDLTDDGFFNLYFIDTDHNHIPDHIFYDKEGDGDLVEIASGDLVEEGILTALRDISDAIALGDYIAERVDEGLKELDRELKRARKELKKLS